MNNHEKIHERVRPKLDTFIGCKTNKVNSSLFACSISRWHVQVRGMDIFSSGYNNLTKLNLIIFSKIICNVITFLPECTWVSIQSNIDILIWEGILTTESRKL